MSGIFLPLALAFAGLLAAFISYRGIRRGGARFYTLEREAILRQASFTLMGSVILFMAAVGLLVYERQQRLTAAAAGEVVEGVVTNTPESFVEQFPPTPTSTPTPDLDAPTPTATPIICRAVVEGTTGTGLTLRDAPSGNQITVLSEGDIVTLVGDESAEAGGYTWRRVTSVFSGEGWVAEEFLNIGAPCR